MGRDSPPHDVQFVRSRGSYVQGADGRRYVDFAAGWCVGNLGWDVREVRTRLRRFDGPDYVHPSYLYGPWTELAKQLAEITPGRLQRSYRATGGTEAVEIALQLAMASTGRSKFVSIEDSYHGNSLGTMSVGASEYREVLPNLLRGCLKVKRPLDANAVDRVERLLRKRDVAAFIMEPIICPPARPRPRRAVHARPPAPVPPLRDAAHPRRGGHGLRTHGPPLRLRALRPRAGHPDAGQGHHRRACGHGRGLRQPNCVSMFPTVLQWGQCVVGPSRERAQRNSAS
jgi:hypothetical protein